MWHGEREQDGLEGRNARLAEQDDGRGTHQGPGLFQGRYGLRRASLLRRPDSLSALPSLARFLRPGLPGDDQIDHLAESEGDGLDADSRPSVPPGPLPRQSRR
jgi:hypothetical protein